MMSGKGDFGRVISTRIEGGESKSENNCSTARGKLTSSPDHDNNQFKPSQQSFEFFKEKTNTNR